VAYCTGPEIGNEIKLIFGKIKNEFFLLVKIVKRFMKPLKTCNKSEPKDVCQFCESVVE